MSFRNNRDFPNRSGNSVAGNSNNYGRNNKELNSERNYHNINSGGIRGGFTGHRGRGSQQTSSRGNYGSKRFAHRNWQHNNRSDGYGNNNSFQKFRGTTELQTASNGTDTTQTQTVPGDNSAAPKSKPKESSTSSSSSSSDTDSSEDSAVRSLKNVVETCLPANKPTEIKPQLSSTVTQAKDVVEPKNESTNLKNFNVKETATKVDNTNKDQTTPNKVISKMKKETNSKSESSSSSTESSSEEDSSSSKEDNDREQESVTNEEEVICLGNLEKFENLVDEESNEAANKTCLLCDKPGHISFHCQMICKNCSGKYHGLKDCPKPANLSIVFSNFMQFCLNQSCRYNPNGEFIIDGNTTVSPSPAMRHVGQLLLPSNEQQQLQQVSTKRKKSRARMASNRSDSSSSNSSSDSRSQMSSSRKKKRRKNSNSNIKSTSAAMQFCNTMPYVAPTGNFNPLNSLLAISHMLGGYNPASMGFQNM